jgi:hypothetical protein
MDVSRIARIRIAEFRFPCVRNKRSIRAPLRA